MLKVGCGHGLEGLRLLSVSLVAPVHGSRSAVKYSEIVVALVSTWVSLILTSDREGW